jgi:hypothetical protein
MVRCRGESPGRAGLAPASGSSRLLKGVNAG